MDSRQLNFRVSGNIAVIFAIALAKPAIAEDQTVDGEKKVLEGHSFHGEAFNEGPR